MRTTAQYLKTLRRIPDDIVLSVATREIEPWAADSCICGWVMREAISLAANSDAEKTTIPDDVPHACMDMFGGTWEEWYGLFGEITDSTSDVEPAFVTRVMEAAGVAR